MMDSEYFDGDEWTHGIRMEENSCLWELEHILEKFIKIQKRYVEIENDTAYDESEAANVSILVSASNKTKGWAGIAEHTADRELGSRGRFDALLVTGEMRYAFEFKQLWINANTMTFTKAINSKIRSSVEQIEAIHNGNEWAAERETVLISGGFFVPETRDAKTVLKKKWREKFINEIAKDFDAVCFVFPTLRSGEIQKRDNGLRRPGVVLAMKEFKEGNR